MGEIVRINAGSKARGFEGVSKLRTQLSGGGTCLWVPSHNVQLGTKHVTENGTYSAASEQLYGYSSVEVDVNPEVDQLTGKKQDGNEYVVQRDGSGNLTETKVPSTIIITQLPLKNVYYSGETIDMTGIVVVAVDGNEEPWTGDGKYPDGIIPINELILPENKAYFDESTEDIYIANSDITRVHNILCGKTVTYKEKYTDRLLTAGFVAGDGMITGYSSMPYGDVSLLGASDKPGAVYSGPYAKNVSLNQMFKRKGKTVYYAKRSLPSNVINNGMQTIPNGTQAVNNYTDETAWTMIYGEIKFAPKQQDVVVQWECPVNGKTLEDSFNILVSKIEDNE